MSHPTLIEIVYNQLIINKLKNKIFILIALTASILQGCANIGQLKGGPKDTKPPQIVQALSTPNLQTNFKKQPIILTFDEWVKLEDVFNQVVVSPPLNERPEVILKGKKLFIKFADDEVLRENATYTINFGDAIKDITEGNAAKSLRFVFSTGPVIDSLEVTARVVDAITGLPTEGVVLMLYDNLSDTVVRKLKPFYFGKTDKEGFTRIENVRAGTFKVFALKDLDLNYLFNQDSENIGFPDSTLTISSNDKDFIKKDTTTRSDSLQRITDSIAAANTSLKIRLFEPRKSLKINGRETDKYGVVKLIFNQEIKKSDVTFDDVKQNALTEISRDSLLIWYNQPDETPWNIYFKGEKQTDTIRIRPRGKVDFMKRSKLTPLIYPLGSITSQILKTPTKPVEIAFNYPIQNIDTNNNNQLIKLIDTSKNVIPLSIKVDSVSKRKLIFEAPWKDGQQYQLTILPNALTDIYGFKNDSIISKINILNKKEFGNIILSIKDLDKGKSYICQILSGTGLVEEEFFIDNVSSIEKRFENMRLDQYSFKIIEDLNKNRVWDTGDYDKKLQPERIFLQKSNEALRADWDLEMEINIRF